MLFITFSDKPIETTPLGQSCAAYGIQPVVLGLGYPWVSNGYKLFLLTQYLKAQDPSELAIVLDAFDVTLFADAQTIENAFMEFNCEVLISAEANFYFNNPDIRQQYLLKYPKTRYPYRFVNSGSYMGKVEHLLSFLASACEANELVLSHENTFKKLKSDQYILSKHFVDHLQLKNQSLRIKLDDEQKLLGCTGGRMSAWRFPFYTKNHAFFFFRMERFFLRHLKITSAQYNAWDYSFDGESFYNQVTLQKPLIFHIPGSKKDFYIRLDYLKTGQIPLKTRLLNLAVFPLSFTAYLVSFFRSLTSRL